MIVTVYFTALGLLLGSFYNLAADRLPRGESLLTPRSHCRACGRKLGFVELIPVAGYLLLRGKCSNCGVPIGIGSPLVEAISGSTFAVPLLLFGVWPGLGIGVALNVAWGGCVVGLGFRLRRRSPQQ